MREAEELTRGKIPSHLSCLTSLTLDPYSEILLSTTTFPIGLSPVSSRDYYGYCIQLIEVMSYFSASVSYFFPLTKMCVVSNQSWVEDVKIEVA